MELRQRRDDELVQWQRFVCPYLVDGAVRGAAVGHAAGGGARFGERVARRACGTPDGAQVASDNADIRSHLGSLRPGHHERRD